MTGWSAFDRFVRTDPSDTGCGPAMDVLDVYAELAVADRPAAEQRYPGVAAHLHVLRPLRPGPRGPDDADPGQRPRPRPNLTNSLTSGAGREPG